MARSTREIWSQRMSEKQEVSEEDFKFFMEALLGPYKGGGYCPE